MQFNIRRIQPQHPASTGEPTGPRGAQKLRIQSISHCQLFNGTVGGHDDAALPARYDGGVRRPADSTHRWYWIGARGKVRCGGCVSGIEQVLSETGEPVAEQADRLNGLVEGMIYQLEWYARAMKRQRIKDKPVWEGPMVSAIHH